MKQCCGKKRNTPYCPQCGRALVAEHPLFSLLKYCRGMRQNCQTRLRTAEQEERSFAIDKHKEQVAKWDVWAEELSKVIQAAAQHEEA